MLTVKQQRLFMRDVPGNLVHYIFISQFMCLVKWFSIISYLFTFFLCLLLSLYRVEEENARTEIAEMAIGNPKRKAAKKSLLRTFSPVNCMSCVLPQSRYNYVPDIYVPIAQEKIPPFPKFINDYFLF